MARVKFKLDRKGTGEILRSAGSASVVAAAASSIQDSARGVVGDDVEVAVTPYVTDRAAASVQIRHPGGLGMQAKYGALTRAAAAVGLDVRIR